MITGAVVVNLAITNVVKLSGNLCECRSRRTN